MYPTYGQPAPCISALLRDTSAYGISFGEPRGSHSALGLRDDDREPDPLLAPLLCCATQLPMALALANLVALTLLWGSVMTTGNLIRSLHLCFAARHKCLWR